MTFYTDTFPPHTRLASGKRVRGGFMQRCGSGILILLAISFTAGLTGCVGSNTGGSAGQGVKTVTLSPSGTQSLEVGAITTFTASATNALGQTVLPGSIQFTVVSGNSNPAPLSITSAGAGCAGTWNSAGICSPGVPGVAEVPRRD